MAKPERAWVSNACAVIAALALLALSASARAQGDATADLDRAISERDAARVRLSQSLSLLSAHENALDRADAATAALLALEALRDETAGPEGEALRDWPRVAEAEVRLNAALDSLRERAVAGMGNDAFCNAFSPDGRRYLKCSHQSAAAYDTMTGEVLAELNLTESETRAARFMADKPTVISATIDGDAVLWNVETNGALMRFEGHLERIISAEFSPDGARLVTAALDGPARLWNVATGDEIAQFGAPGQDATTIAYSADGERVATKSLDGWVQIWSAADASEIARFKIEQVGQDDAFALETYVSRLLVGSAIDEMFAALDRLLLSPDGRWIVVAPHFGRPTLWRADTGEMISALNSATSATKFSFNADGSRLLVSIGSGPGDPAFVWSLRRNRFERLRDDAPSGEVEQDFASARLLDSETGAEIIRLSIPESPLVGARFTPDGRRILAWVMDGDMILLDARTGVEVARLGGHPSAVRNVVFDPKSDRMTSTGDDFSLRFWELPPPAVSIFADGAFAADGVFSPSGAFLLTTDNETVALRDTESGETLASTDVSHVLDIAFGSKRAVAAAIIESGDLVFIDPRSDQPLAVFKTSIGNELFGGGFYDLEVSLSPDGSRAAIKPPDAPMMLWDLEKDERIVVLDGADSPVAAHAFDPSGELFATANRDGSLSVLDARTGAEVSRLASIGAPAHSIALAPSAARVTAFRYIGASEIWDLERGTSIALPADAATIGPAFFSPDGRFLVTNGEGLATQLWDASTGAPVARLQFEAGVIASLRFTDDGRRIRALSDEGAIRDWPAPLIGQALVDHAKRVVPRCLSPEQRRAFHLPPAPPRWCVTGPGQEAETDPALWKPKWPYHTPEWRGWLAAVDRGETPPLPAEQ